MLVADVGDEHKFDRGVGVEGLEILLEYLILIRTLGDGDLDERALVLHRLPTHKPFERGIIDISHQHPITRLEAPVLTH